jgi:DNA-binding PadR family transcriptional regulator
MLTRKESAVLALLCDGGEKYGLELVRESNGELKRGTVYGVLNHLEERGLVTSRPIGEPAWAGGPNRRGYVITGDGRRVLAWWEQAPMSLGMVVT